MGQKNAKITPELSLPPGPQIPQVQIPADDNQQERVRVPSPIVFTNGSTATEPSYDVLAIANHLASREPTDVDHVVSQLAKIVRLQQKKEQAKKLADVCLNSFKYTGKR